ncbi:MAG: hydantoinase B/oxoprolinase family protein [Thermoleophilaceae bacterium]
MRYSLITERRRHAPPGASGGEPGAPGANLVNGREQPPKASGRLKPGDRLRIETPGAAATDRAEGAPLVWTTTIRAPAHECGP